ncbi:universal stress protein [Dyadobacter pollutisoli]|uniref:Universal stress protein n=1 Tax=Dyadobacter pollutisoli TaxID=2910158 RepID=A0A9E8SQV4_9BACT|nr:universal stress protein [Dyadobacter pollutisoli]WAC13472.1 universal stress protein [Dyadobacter pollutisoli]
MQKILVPCDFSMSALLGLEFAVELAHATSGAIIVLSVTSQPPEDEGPPVSERYREDFENFVIGVSQPVHIQQQIRFGRLLPAVSDVIIEESVDLIVMGTRGSRGWDSTFIGSNVERILRRSPVPVFAVNQKSHLGNLKNIVLPCNLILEDHFGMVHLKKLQTLLNARLHLLRVDTTTDGTNHQVLAQKVSEYASFHSLSKFTINIVTDTDERDGILRFAKEIDADMIAMTTHGSRDLGHLYTFSVAADVVNHAHLLTWTCAQQSVSQLL